MSTVVAIGIYLTYAGWRVVMDQLHKRRQQKIQRSIDELVPRIERLERIANNDPYGLPKPLDL